MAFADSIDRPGLIRFITLRLSGLPIVLSNVPCPAAWDVGGGVVEIAGEQYQWLPVLKINGELRGFAERLECYAGVGTADTITLQALAVSELLELLDLSDEWPQLIEDLLFDGSTAVVDDAEALTADSLAYLADETVRAGTPAGTSLPLAERGLFGSLARTHVAQWDGVSERDYAGAYVASTPLTHAGRTAWLHLCPATWSPEAGLVPQGDPPTGHLGENWLAATGRVERFEEAAGAIEIELADLTCLLSRSAGSRLPRAEVGHYGLIQIDAWSSGVYVDEIDEMLGTTREHRVTLSPPRPLVTPQELAGMIWDVLGGGIPDIGGAVLETVAGEAGWCWRLRVDINAMVLPAPKLRLLARPSSVWTELGLVEDVELTADVSSGRTEWRYLFPCRPIYRLPATGLRTVWLQRAAVADLWPGVESGCVDAAGDPLQEVVQLGDEIVGCEATTCTVQGTTRHGVALLRRGLFGTVARVEVSPLDEFEAEPVEARGGLSLCGCEWPQAIAYALCAGRDDGGDYGGAGWRGAGGAIPDSLVDLGQIQNLLAGPGGGDKIDLWISEATPLRDLLQPILVARGCYLHTRNGALFVGQIPSPTVEEEAAVLDAVVVTSREGWRWSRGERNILHTVRATELAGTGSTRTAIAGGAAGTWPDAPALELRLAWLSTVARAEQEADRAASEVLGRWARPYARHDVRHTAPAGWLLELGAAVELTHVLPVEGGQRGVAGLPGRVFARTPILVGSACAELTVLYPGRGGARPCTYAPSARVTAITVGTGSSRLDCEEYYYGPTAGLVPDARRFAVGDKVSVFMLGAEDDTSYLATVTAVADDSLEVDAEVDDLSGAVVVECAEWDDATTRQRRHAYVADGDSRPWRIGGDTAPATYE